MKRRIAAFLIFVLVLSTCMTAMAASYSVNWKQAADGNWQAFNNGVLLKNTWILDDQCDVAGGLYYLVDENGNLVSSQLIKDGEGRYYTFNDQHDGHFGAMRTANGKYQGVNLTFSAVHDGSFGSITNADGIKALAAKVGVKEMPNIKNASMVKMSELNKVASSTSGGSQEYTVYRKLSFDVNLATADPSVIDAQMIKTGGKGIKPASPSDANGKMTFTGWTVTKDGTDYWDFEKDTVTKDVKLFAKWTDTTYTVSFDLNNANAVPASIESQTVVEEQKATKPATPSDATKKKEFMGWTETKDGDDYWIFEEDIVTEDVKLFAKWIDVNYLTFTAGADDSSVTFKYMSGTDVQYRKDGEIWTDCPYGTTVKLAKAGDVVQFRGINTVTGYNSSTKEYENFSMTGTFAASGSVTSLTDGNGADANVRLSPYCYASMFKGCTGLTEAPELPATSLYTGCYSKMFLDCTQLTKATELPATSLVNDCYKQMFSGCTKLRVVENEITGQKICYSSRRCRITPEE